MSEATVVAPRHAAAVRAGDLAWVGSHGTPPPVPEPLPFLAYRDMMVEIDTVALVRPR